MDRGEGQQWNLAPGNLYGTPVQVTIDRDATIDLTLDKVIPVIPPPTTTRYIRHERIRSEKLSKFWGGDVRWLDRRLGSPRGSGILSG